MSIDTRGFQLFFVIEYHCRHYYDQRAYHFNNWNKIWRVEIVLKKKKYMYVLVVVNFIREHIAERKLFSLVNRFELFASTLLFLFFECNSSENPPLSHKWTVCDKMEYQGKHCNAYPQTRGLFDFRICSHPKRERNVSSLKAGLSSSRHWIREWTILFFYVII